jgi:hypothetical protein
MSKDPHSIPKSAEVCVLFCATNFQIITIQTLKIENRVAANNQRWMADSNQRWLTLDEYEARTGDRRDQILESYQPLLTWSDLKFRDNQVIR